MKRILFISAMVLAGCYDEESTQYPDGVTMNADGTPSLIEISPGVEVVADYSVPIFFADDYYWWFDGGLWWQSSWYGGGWVHAGNIPPRVAGIANREQYAHYRPAGWASRAPSPHGFAQARSSFRSRPAPHGGGRGGGRR